MLGQKGPHSARQAKDREQAQHEPGDDTLAQRNVPPVQLEIEGDGEDDGDDGAEGSAEKGADRVEGGEEDGDQQQDGDDEHADQGLQAGADQGRRARHGAGPVAVEAADDVGRGDEGPRVERDLGQRDDGDEDAHEDGRWPGEARSVENVGRDHFLGAVAEHEDADNGQASVERVLGGRD